VQHRDVKPQNLLDSGEFGLPIGPGA
jgi:hypothetical protein